MPGNSEQYPDKPATRKIERPTNGEIRVYTDQLLYDKTAKRYRYLVHQRAIPAKILRQFRIGWDPKRLAYTIPLLDEAEQLECVKWIKPAWNSDDGKKHVWVCNTDEIRWPMLFPTYELRGHDPIIVCEGEWDTLSVISLGLFAVTATGGAGQWDQAWSYLFKYKDVYILPDADEPGKDHEGTVARALWDAGFDNLTWPHRDRLTWPHPPPTVVFGGVRQRTRPQEPRRAPFGRRVGFWVGEITWPFGQPPPSGSGARGSS